MTRDEIKSQVIDIVADQLGVDDKATIGEDTSFVNDLGADSLDTVELVMEFEEKFKTSIPDEKAEQLKTVGEAVDFICEVQGAGA